jgi:hypothetical protein
MEEAIYKAVRICLCCGNQWNAEYDMPKCDICGAKTFTDSVEPSKLKE